MASRLVATQNYKHLPPIAGCYVIFQGNAALYVGSAANLKARFYTHQIEVGYINGKPRAITRSAIHVKYRPSVKYGDWRMVELRLIRRLRTPFNDHHHIARLAVSRVSVPRGKDAAY